MKSKNFIPIIFVAIGIIGLILLIFGLQFNGTLSDEIKKAGFTGLGIFAIWAAINLVEAFQGQKELENM